MSARSGYRLRRRLARASVPAMPPFLVDLTPFGPELHHRPALQWAALTLTAALSASVAAILWII